VKSERLCSDHHGRITRIRSIAGFTFFETRYEASLRLPQHSHDHACICVVVAGDFQEDFQRHKLQLCTRSIAFRPAAEMHEDRFGSGGSRCLVIEVPDAWVAHVKQSGHLLDEPICIQRGPLQWLGMRLYQEYRAADEGAPLVIEGIMLEIAGGFSRRPPHRGGKTPLWLEWTREAVRANYGRTLRVQELAASAGVHPVHLSREFQRHYRCSVVQYARKLRIQAACEKLAHSDSSIADVALEVGFSNQAHFSRTFGLATGMSPSRYRAWHRG
jgi:AraC family transcriptional regulator